MSTFRYLLCALALLPVLACADAGAPFEREVIADFDEPWALAFLPDGRMLVTEKKGNLFVVSRDGDKAGPVDGVPDVAYGGQGGLGDVVLHPNFADNGLVYLSYAESGTGDTRGAAVARGVLDTGGARRSGTSRYSGASIRRCSGTATTATGCCSTTRATCGSPPVTGRNSRRRRTCRPISAR